MGGSFVYGQPMMMMRTIKEWIFKNVKREESQHLPSFSCCSSPWQNNNNPKNDSFLKPNSCDYHVIMTGFYGAGKTTLIYGVIDKLKKKEKETFPTKEKAARTSTSKAAASTRRRTITAVSNVQTYIPTIGFILEYAWLDITSPNEDNNNDDDDSSSDGDKTSTTRILLTIADIGGEDRIRYFYSKLVNPSERHKTKLIYVIDASSHLTKMISWNRIGRNRPNTGRELNNNKVLVATLRNKLLQVGWEEEEEEATASGENNSNNDPMKLFDSRNDNRRNGVIYGFHKQDEIIGVELSWEEIRDCGLAYSLRWADYVKVGNEYFQHLPTYDRPGYASMPYQRAELDKYFLSADEYRDCPIIFLANNKQDQANDALSPNDIYEGMRLYEFEEERDKVGKECSTNIRRRNVHILPCTARRSTSPSSSMTDKKEEGNITIEKHDDDGPDQILLQAISWLIGESEKNNDDKNNDDDLNQKNANPTLNFAK